MFDNSKQYEILVRPLGRKQADEYYHDGSIWVEGREGNSYTIELRNHSYNRVLFILSVDGLDAIEGKPAGVDSQGYVLPGKSNISVPGWKLNDREAAEFFFSRKQDSYVNSIGGSTANTGVIGTMIFQEKQVVNPYNIAKYYSGNNSVTSFPTSSLTEDYWMAPSNMTANQGSHITDLNDFNNKLSRGLSVPASYQQLSATSAASVNTAYVSQDVATGFGKATNWNNNEVAFERENPANPDCIMAIYYNTAKNLEKMGIQLRKRRDASYKADPFPAYSSSSRGCNPPIGWKG